MHYQLTVLSVEINELFECPILVIAAVNFEVITFCVYVFLGAVASGANLLMETINTALYCIILATEMFLILVAFQGMQQMVCVSVNVEIRKY